jgi:hypothetical protein
LRANPVSDLWSLNSDRHGSQFDPDQPPGREQQALMHAGDVTRQIIAEWL